MNTDLTAGLTSKRLIGYFPAWGIHAQNYHVADIPARQLTHVIYAFAGISTDGKCVSIYPKEDQVNLPQLLQLKQQHSSLKTLISVGGAKDSTNFPIVAATDAARQLFAKSCVDYMKQNGFDGIDIDWEYPRAQDKQNFTALLAELRRQLDTQGQADGKHYLLTIAAPASASNYANLELDKIVKSLDWINLMAYDFVVASSKQTGLIAPLYPPTSNPAQQTRNVDAAVKAYLAAHVPAIKIVMGVRFVGTGWEGVPNTQAGLYQSDTGPAKGTWDTHAPYSGEFGYQDVEFRYLDRLSGYARHWHPKSEVPWLYSPTAQTLISYEDPQSLHLKAGYVVANRLGGIMIWELGADDKQHSLVNAIAGGL